jgi:uncharacterized membrane protein YjgN (DUF898 family)
MNDAANPGAAGPWGPRSVPGARAAMDAAEAAARAAAPPPSWTEAGGPPPPTGWVNPAVAMPQPSGNAAMGFIGTGGRLFGLLLGGFFLQILTLGIYRFWLITDVRRFYWSSTYIGSEQITYTGRGLELFKGFLVALALIVPIKALAFFLALGVPAAEGVISVAVILILIFLGQFAVYAGRRYRLTRTSWRGLRLRMTGSALTYAAKAFGLSLVAIATLGLAFPWTTAYLEKIKMRETWYGDVQGDFVGRPLDLFKSGILIWAIGFGLPVLLVAVAFAKTPEGFLSALLHDLMQGDMNPRGPVASALAALGGALTLAVFVALALFPAFQAVLFRWRMNGTRIGGAGFVSTMTIGRSYRVYVLGALAAGGLSMIVSTVIGGLMVAAIFAMSVGSDPFLRSSGGGVAGVVIGVVSYLLIFAAAWIFKQIFIDLRLTRARILSLTVTNLVALDGVSARNVEASAMGDSLGDAVDLGIGF